MTRLTVIRQWIQVAFGLFVFSFGVHLEIFADIGLAPWDCLAMGMSYHLPFNYGACVTIVAVVILIIDIIMREQIGFGTIFDALLCGPYIQFFNDYNPLPREHSTLMGVAIMLLGFVAYGLSIHFYIMAQKELGAAKTSAYYSVAPFLGVLFSFLILREKPSAQFFAALAIMIVSTILMVKDTVSLQHSHEHTHIHTHEHSHGDMVHTHEHKHIHTHIHTHSGDSENHTHEHALTDHQHEHCF